MYLLFIEKKVQTLLKSTESSLSLSSSYLPYWNLDNESRLFGLENIFFTK